MCRPSPCKRFPILNRNPGRQGQPKTYGLTVTVEQYQFDGDDGTRHETHNFPKTVTVSWQGGTATLQGAAPGIQYARVQTRNVSAYQVVFPHALKSTTELSVGPFYLVGPTQQSGWHR